MFVNIQVQILFNEATLQTYEDEKDLFLSEKTLETFAIKLDKKRQSRAKIWVLNIALEVQAYDNNLREQFSISLPRLDFATGNQL